MTDAYGRDARREVLVVAAMALARPRGRLSDDGFPVEEPGGYPTLVPLLAWRLRRVYAILEAERGNPFRVAGLFAVEEDLGYSSPPWNPRTEVPTRYLSELRMEHRTAMGAARDFWESVRCLLHQEDVRGPAATSAPTGYVEPGADEEERGADES